jgi:hypothetical protein
MSDKTNFINGMLFMLALFTMLFTFYIVTITFKERRLYKFNSAGFNIAYNQKEKIVEKQKQERDSLSLLLLKLQIKKLQ